MNEFVNWAKFARFSGLKRFARVAKISRFGPPGPINGLINPARIANSFSLGLFASDIPGGAEQCELHIDFSGFCAPVEKFIFPALFTLLFVNGRGPELAAAPP